MFLDEDGLSMLWDRIRAYVSLHSGDDFDIPVATTSSPGKVRPDGTTITIDADGTISAVGTGGPHLAIREDSEGRRRLAIVIPEEG